MKDTLSDRAGGILWCFLFVGTIIIHRITNNVGYGVLFGIGGLIVFATCYTCIILPIRKLMIDRHKKKTNIDRRTLNTKPSEYQVLTNDYLYKVRVKQSGAWIDHSIKPTYAEAGAVVSQLRREYKLNNQDFRIVSYHTGDDIDVVFDDNSFFNQQIELTRFRGKKIA